MWRSELGCLQVVVVVKGKSRDPQGGPWSQAGLVCWFFSS